jgi:hypothetical protein
MEPFVKDNLKAIKELFFIGLDFMHKNFSTEDLVQYGMINKREFLKLGIEEAEVDSWLFQWGRDKDK